MTLIEDIGASRATTADQRTAARATISNRKLPLARFIGLRYGQTCASGQQNSRQSWQRAVFYTKEFVIGFVGLFALDVAWRFMDWIIDDGIIAHVHWLKFLGDG